eukprot:COSAG01_NODE_4508_length_4967_cov_4.284100_2_plen_54_part_00
MATRKDATAAAPCRLLLARAIHGGGGLLIPEHAVGVVGQQLHACAAWCATQGV